MKRMLLFEGDLSTRQMRKNLTLTPTESCRPYRKVNVRW